MLGPAQIGWALVVIAAALIGGLAASALVHASLVVAVIVSVVIGAIGVLVSAPLARAVARADRPLYQGHRAAHPKGLALRAAPRRPNPTHPTRLPRHPGAVVGRTPETPGPTA